MKNILNIINDKEKNKRLGTTNKTFIEMLKTKGYFSTLRFSYKYNGRISNRAYKSFYYTPLILSFITSPFWIIGFIINNYYPNLSIFFIGLGDLGFIIFFIPFFFSIPAIIIRRLHDVNKSGIWIFIHFGLISISDKASQGENKYGPDPLKI